MTFKRRNNFTIIVTVAVLLVMVLVIPVTANPAVDFNGTPRSGAIPLTVTFSDNSTGNGTLAYAWEFGDGGTSTSQNPSHPYNIAGTYAVTLTVTDNDGPTLLLRPDYITALVAPPNALFSTNVTSGTAPLTVGFTDASTGTAPLSYAWDFTNDGVTDNTNQNPTHTYPTAGLFTANLTVTNAAGTDFVTHAITVNAAPVAPNALFSTNVTSGTAPLTVGFTDASTGTAPLSYAWDFTNDGITDNTNQNPTHTYPTAGLFTANLTVTNAAGTDFVTHAITVNAAPVAPNALFSTNVTSGTAPLTVGFIDASTGTAPLSYAWDFTNDGVNDSSVQNPSYTYSTAGSYTAKLTVTNIAGSNAVTHAITVNAAPVAPNALFSTNVTSGTAPLTVGFIDASTGTAPLSYAWDFTNDGVNDSSVQNPSYTYSTAGSYTAKLTVTNIAGSNAVTHAITVNAAPVAPTALFSTNVTSGSLPLTVGFIGASTGSAPLSYAWDFTNDGITDSTLKNPIHAYLTTGSYTANLTVTNTAGSNAVTHVITVTNTTTKIGIYQNGVWNLDLYGNGGKNLGADTYLPWDNAGIDLPIAGDWNGDGRTETGVYRPGAGFFLKMDNGSTWNPSTDRYLAWDNAAIDLPIAGDWNGDGRTETGVYRPGAGFYLKMDNGSTWNPATDVYLAWDNAGIDLPIAGDWNGDGRTETGVYRPGAGFYLKMDNGSTWNPATDVYLAWDNAGIDRPLAGDWNGDGRTETGVYRPGAGFYLKMDAGSSWNPATDVYLAWDNAGIDRPLAGDWNGDGRPETSVYRPGAGFYLKMDAGSSWNPSTVFNPAYTFRGEAGGTPIVGDWDGNGNTKIGVYKNGAFSLDVNGNRAWDTGSDKQYNFALTSDFIPIVGDWNGDRTTKIGYYRWGYWSLDYYGQGIISVPYSPFFGQANDLISTPVVGDWDGNGKTKIGLYQTTEGQSSKGAWYLDLNGDGAWDSGSDRVFNFGENNPGVPVIGDWNGDGKSKIGVFRDGSWRLDYNGNGTLIKTYSFGTAGSIPVIGDWNGDGRSKIGIYKPGNGDWNLDYDGNGVNSVEDKVYNIGLGTPVVGKWT